MKTHPEPWIYFEAHKRNTSKYQSKQRKQTITTFNIFLLYLFLIFISYLSGIFRWKLSFFMFHELPGFWQGILINVNMKILCANNGLWCYLITSLSPPFTQQTLSQRETRRLWDVIKHSVLIFTGLIGTMNSSGWKLWITFCCLVLS